MNYFFFNIQEFSIGPMRMSLCDDVLGLIISYLPSQSRREFHNFISVSHGFSKIYLMKVTLSRCQFCTLFKILVWGKRMEYLKYFLNNRNPNTYEPNLCNKLFQWASQDGHLEVVKLLLFLNNEKSGKYHIDPSADNNIAIRLTSANGHINVVKFLISLNNEKNNGYRIDPSADNNSAIREASAYGHLEIVKYLISLNNEKNNGYRIDPSADNNSAIREASAYGHLDIVKYLISLNDEKDKGYHIDPSVSDNGAINAAYINDHLEVIEFLLSLDKKYGIKRPPTNELVRNVKKYMCKNNNFFYGSNRYT